MSTRTRIVIGGLVAIVALAAGGAWWYLRDDAPPEVSLEAAVESVEGGGEAAAGEGDAAGDPATPGGGDSGAGIEGTWVVDTDTGTFSFDQATGTFAGFRIEEELSGVGSTTAVGRTPAITGEIRIDGTTLSAATFEADLTQITTDRSQRDRAVQRALDTGQFPTATFTLTDPVDMGDAAAAGGPVAVTAVGELTIRGVTRTVEFPLEAQLVDGTVAVVGSVPIVFADYDVEVPTAPVVVSAEDNGILEVQLLFTRA